jgi:hypothetical protein
MVKKMVFTSAGDNTNFDELWINCNQTYDIYVIYFGDDEANQRRIWTTPKTRRR